MTRAGIGRWRLAALAAFVSIGVTLAAPAATPQEADAAFAAGDHDRALSLYDEILVERPDDPHALFRSGQLLSWSRRYDEAIARYDRLLEIDPDHPRAALERAKVMSWDRRFDDAEAAFLAALERDPASTEARLGYARTCSWGGKQRKARRAYRAILDDDPGNADALVGVAQTFAWSGDRERARSWYERALDAEPGKKEAVLGLAYLDLWTPERAETEARLADLEKRFPTDAEVADARLARERAERWWTAAGWDWLDDTEDNRMDVFRAEAGVGPATRWDVSFGVARYDLRSPVGEGTIDSVYAVAGWNPMPRHRLTFRLGRDFTEDSAGGTDDRMIGGLAWRYTPRTWWELELAANRDTLRYSPLINDNRIVIDSLRATATTRPAERWRAIGTVDAWDVSDGNARRGLLLEGWYLLPPEPVRVEVGYTFQWADWDETLDNGYFSPENFTAHLGRVRVWGTLPVRDGRWEVGAGAGVQSFTLRDVTVRNDTVVGLNGRVSVPLTSRLTLDVYAIWTDYAAQSAAGFESRQAGFRVRWQF